ncbi:hypothetical protein BURMUCF2_A1650 [Burkholderia multivorans CF2]|nr:hypothetical protein BURMUCF2_A1650 [Burkholderia multivorans CF2]
MMPATSTPRGDSTRETTDAVWRRSAANGRSKFILGRGETFASCAISDDGYFKSGRIIPRIGKRCRSRAK